jgi:hypothetical protein
MPIRREVLGSGFSSRGHFKGSFSSGRNLAMKRILEQFKVVQTRRSLSRDEIGKQAGSLLSMPFAPFRTGR